MEERTKECHQIYFFLSFNCFLEFDISSLKVHRKLNVTTAKLDKQVHRDKIGFSQQPTFMLFLQKSASFKKGLSIYDILFSQDGCPIFLDRGLGVPSLKKP